MILLWFLWESKEVCLIVVRKLGIENLIFVLKFDGIKWLVLG